MAGHSLEGVPTGNMPTPTPEVSEFLLRVVWNVPTLMLVFPTMMSPA